MKPVIGVICETNQQGLHQYHQTGDKYLQAITRCADCVPLLIPALSDQIAPKDYLPRLDGLLLTGGYSNVDRQLYRLPPAPAGEHEDPARDALAMSLIPSILVAGMPLFGICRGFQELNVALGGTLHPRLQEVDGKFDHRENTDDPIEAQYGPAHSVTSAEGGLLHQITGEREFMVNSVHGQGIHKLAAGLVIEAEADDGTIEATSVEDAQGFALAVQWHPEWQAWDNPQSKKLFGAFGDAARSYQSSKRRGI
ncbi:MAG: gamma-glutamyl-gamma-aminobutyrate hydrolase family protein [Kordiimonadaceae bacterium]|nr:gamma-glutamyl-gamma-aminobutyrate hydrolase family protein [Kordiimonadaceae bacterium]MBO6570624.1 gamma-glutamyl-gamma-aminobutyrate hydrolase family protein [Kordiimonadaceae bacterium]MBO6966518.1 gamma-glutamyl-gamma-aminobutyrate hydrolase family protein [Kordiimonadaceae bacterium]